MAEINTNIYGEETDWVSVYQFYAAGTEEKDKLKVANFGDNHTTIGAALGEGILKLNTPWDKSLSYCGLGEEAPLSNIGWFAKLPRENDGSDGNNVTLWEKKDTRYVTNFALGMSAEGITGPTLSRSNGYWVKGDQWSPNKFKFNRWNDGSVYNNDMSNYRTFSPYTAIPLHRVVLVPIIQAARTDNYTTTFDLISYFRDNNKYYYPRIRQIGMRIAIDPDPSKYSDINEAPLTGFQRIIPGEGMREIAILENTIAFEGEESDNYGPLNTTATLGKIYLPVIGGCPDSGDQYCPIAGDLYGCANIQDNWQDAFLLRPYCSGFGLNFNRWSKIESGNWRVGDNGYLYCDASELSDNEIKEAVRHMVACFGMFFVDGADDLNVSFYDNKMMLGILDEANIGHGDYSRGLDNKNQKQWNMEDAHDFDYDPSDPPRKGDNPTGSQDPLLPNPLTWTMATAGGGTWALTHEELSQALNDIFGAEVKPSMYGTNPLDAIISVQWTPFKWSSSTTAPIILGNTIVNQIHQYPLLNSVNNAEKSEFGEMKFEFNKNFYNSRYMQARLWLPFYGFYQLPMSQLLSSRLRIDFYYDVPDVVGAWYISFGDIYYDHVECNPNIDIPITGSNAAAEKASKMSTVLNAANQVLQFGLGVILTAVGVKGTGAQANAALGLNAATGRSTSTTPLVQFDGAPTGPNSMSLTNFNNTKFLANVAKQGMILGGVQKGTSSAQGIINTVYQGAIERATLRTTLPYHSTASATTFLHLPMFPFIQIWKNDIFDNLDKENEGYVSVELGGDDKAQYMLKVGHACDIFTTIDKMPADSLLQTTGMADNDVEGMTAQEYQELNAILQTGFFQ